MKRRNISRYLRLTSRSETRNLGCSISKHYLSNGTTIRSFFTNTDIRLKSWRASHFGVRSFEKVSQNSTNVSHLSTHIQLQSHYLRMHRKTLDLKCLIATGLRVGRSSKSKASQVIHREQATLLCEMLSSKMTIAL